MPAKTGNGLKKALLTGGTSGIGLSIARELILQDYQVVLIGRNRQKGQAIAFELNTQRPESTQFVELDLSNLNSVLQFSDQFMTVHERLDVLANIAGAMYPKRQETQEGLEKNFAVNYLSAFLLSTQLVPLLERTQGARIVNVAAAPSQMLKESIDFDDLQFAKKYSGFKAATAAVHAKTVLSEILSEQYTSKGIDVNSFDPGFVRSHLMDNMPLMVRGTITLLWPLFAKTSTNGVYACSCKEIQGVTGMLFHKKKAIPLHFEKPYKERLWKQTEDLVAKVLQR
ncbi:MAG: SDR family NAD(P)-dependent oxidoreductase [Desulfatitalea sp.]|nr:SDR family NAD(P)-dependent oxidoreductase [Desulfatitalea sp.]NNK01253.1 SDR family NAD(P)-dependent oxidoreductase [Desulfatitalea sp.]